MTQEEFENLTPEEKRKLLSEKIYQLLGGGSTFDAFMGMDEKAKIYMFGNLQGSLDALSHIKDHDTYMNIFMAFVQEMCDGSMNNFIDFLYAIQDMGPSFAQLTHKFIRAHNKLLPEFEFNSTPVDHDEYVKQRERINFIRSQNPDQN